MNGHSAQPAVTINGEARPLRLTLGALCEIEEALGGGDFDVLKKRLARPSVGDLIVILHALLGGGGASLTVEALKASDIDLSEAARAVANAFTALGNDVIGDDGASGGNVGEAPGKPAAPDARRTMTNGADGSSLP